MPNIHMRSKGCDAFYFLLSIETYRKDKTLPITLPPYYLLEDAEQSYPPGFSVFCSFLPNWFIQKYYWLLNHLIDWLTACVGFLIAYFITDNIGASLLTMILYALQPGILQEFRTLTSRSLSLLLFNLMLLGTVLSIDVSLLYIIPSAIAGVLLIYSHKLTMQVIWFLAPFMTLLTGEWQWLVVPILSYILAMVINPKLFYALQRHHWDMIIFWSHHWKDLGRGHIDDSPLFETGKCKKAMYKDDEFGSWIRYIKKLLHEAPFIPLAIVGLIFQDQLNQYQNILLFLQVSIFSAAILVICLPFLRGIGNGWQYTKYSALPVAIFTSSILLEEQWGLLQYLYLGAFFMMIIVYIKMAYSFLQKPAIKDDVDFEALSEGVKNLPDSSRFICLPLELCDHLVYKARKTVLWGSHSYPFQLLEDFFPVLKKPITYYKDKYKLTHAIIDKECYIPQQLGFSYNPVLSFGRYHVYSLEDYKG